MSNSRENNSTRATIHRSELFASGTFKNVYEGRYTAGGRAGERCVAKEFKTGSVYEEHYFNEEMNIIRCSQKVVDDWHAADLIDKRILLNTPEIWTYEGSGAKSLIEPMIENFEKFNSNSGWVDTTNGAWGQVMQALSHYSYHNSGGQLLLCDLQGGLYNNG
ncbi:MHCK/EF2 kinase [Xylaria sp. FL1042]|nr:MHCK/EF2 kinase [Xylaria sp. FL1042]